MSREVQQSSELSRISLHTGQQLSTECRQTTGIAEKYFTVEELTKAVRTTIGTPFRHAGRVVGKDGGLDCGGIMVAALRHLGIDVKDKKYYNRKDGIADMVEVLTWNDFYTRENGEPAIAGDLILIRGKGIYHHLVYVTEIGTIIHAWYTAGVNQVVESTMLPEWLENIHSVWRWKWVHLY